MKKILLFLFSLALLIAIGCNNAQKSADTPGNKVEYVYADLGSVDAIQADVYLVQDESPGEVATEIDETSDSVSAGDFLKNNFLELLLGLMAFIEIVVRLTPTTKDNSILNLVMTILNAIIPNFKKAGGKFTVLKE